MFRSFLIAASMALVWLGMWASFHPPGIGYLDYPVTAQDEAVYSHAAIRMAESGGWSTPMFLDRFFLYKPPLLYWLSALSVKIFGVKSWALRLPAMLAAACMVGLVFAWVRRDGGWPRGASVATLLLLSPLCLELGRRNMTDSLIALVIVTSVWLVAEDPRLERGVTVAGLAACVGAGILAKSIAGLIPLFILGAIWIASQERPRLIRIIAAAGLGIVIALPWFVYQWETHRRWFEAEFVGVELLAYGAMAPPQTNEEWAIFFYPRRLWAACPGLCVAMLFALVGLEEQLRARRAGAPLVIAAALVTMVAAILGYQYHNATYVLPLLPLMAVAGGLWSRPLGLGLAIVLVLFVAALPLRPFRHPGQRIVETAVNYCEMGRANELVVIGVGDDFSISTLPLARLRYAIQGAARPTGGFTLDFRSMGIVLPSGEFQGDLAAARERYAPKLREWGLPDDRALGSVVGWETPADLAKLVEANPERDFLVPYNEAPALEALGPAVASHRMEKRPGALLLLARGAKPHQPHRPCRL